MSNVAERSKYDDAKPDHTSPQKEHKKMFKEVNKEIITKMNVNLFKLDTHLKGVSDALIKNNDKVLETQRRN